MGMGGSGSSGTSLAAAEAAKCEGNTTSRVNKTFRARNPMRSGA